MRGKPEVFAEFRKSVARQTRGFRAPENCIKAVEAAVNLPFDQGLKRERELFQELITSPESKAQRYFFFAEREAAKIPDVPGDTPSREIKKAAVLGAGTMGGGIAMNFANAGIPVTVVEVAQDALDRGLGVVRKNYEATASRGRLTPQDVEKRMGLISGTTDWGKIADADIVVEAVFEEMPIKKEVFAKIDKICKPGAVLATNTSTLDVDEIASATARPDERDRHALLQPRQRHAPARGGAREAVGQGRGGHRDGRGSPHRQGAGVRGRLLRLRGQPHAAPARTRGREAHPRGRAAPRGGQGSHRLRLPDGPVRDGRPRRPRRGLAHPQGQGREVGGGGPHLRAGPLRPEDRRGLLPLREGDRTPIPDPDVEKIIVEVASEMGITRRKIGDDEILARLLYPMVNEGAKILEEKIAIRASDIDVIWVYGYGWPVYRGGPMFWADQVGLKTIRDRMQEWRKTQGDVWTPAPLLDRLATEGKTFTGA